jgi:hypothetical protein
MLMRFRRRAPNHDAPASTSRPSPAIRASDEVLTDPRHQLVWQIRPGHRRDRRRAAHERVADALEMSARKHVAIAAHLRSTGQGGLAAGYERLAASELAEARQYLRRASGG